MFIFSKGKSWTKLSVFSTRYKWINPLEKNRFFRGTRIFTAFLGCCARDSPIICAMDCCIELICQKVMVAFRIFIAGLAKFSAFLDFRNRGLKRLKKILNSPGSLHLYSQYLGKKALDHEAAMTWMVLEKKSPLHYFSPNSALHTNKHNIDWMIFVHTLHPSPCLCCLMYYCKALGVKATPK